MQQSLFQAAADCLAAVDVDDKLRLTHQAAAAWREGQLTLEPGDGPAAIGEPGRPPRPELVLPTAVPRRGLGSTEGRAALVHAVTHIEFNAINLAWDAVYRFRDQPQRFYSDWVRVAKEEAEHFDMLRKRLRDMGYEYGDFPAHNGLWDMAKKTDFDPMVRMALVPRVLEARGLDVTPGIIKRLTAAGDFETVAALEVILREEVGHVEIGSRWFKHHCDLRGLEPKETFRDLIRRYYVGPLRGPFDYEARKQAGFSEDELQALETFGVE